MTPDEWMAENKESLATEEEMRRYANIAKPKSEVPEVRELIHWTTEEVLLAPVSVKAPRSRKAPWFLVLMMGEALISVAFQALAPVKVAKAAFESMNHDKVV